MEIHKDINFAAIARQIASDIAGICLEPVEEISNRGLINRVFKAEVPNRPLVIRLNADPNAETNYYKESWCIDKALEQGILVPHVVDFGKRSGVAYMVQDFIPGVAGTLDASNKLQLWSQIGRYAALANAIPVKGCGGRMSATEPGVFLDTWESHVQESLGITFRDDYWSRTSLFTADEVDHLRESLSACAALQVQLGLCHVDIGPLNCVLHNGDIEQLYLLDWEFAEAAPVPHYQFACVAKYWGFNSQIMSAFLEGYGISAETLEEIRNEVMLLTALGALESVRWAQDNIPEKVKEYSESAQFILRDTLLK